MYTIYCSGHKQAVELAMQLAKKNPKFAAFLDAAKLNVECKGLTLKDYLIKPIQRICKYPLLFKELLSETPETSPQYTKIQETLTKCSEIATHVNKSADHVEVNKVIELESKLEPPIPGCWIKADRRYLRDNIFSGVTITKNSLVRIREVVELHVILFNDMVSICKPKKHKKISLLFSIPYLECTVKDVQDVLVSYSKGYKHAFELFHDKEKSIVTLFFSTEGEKLEWINFFEVTIKNYRNQRDDYGNGEKSNAKSPEEVNFILQRNTLKQLRTENQQLKQQLSSSLQQEIMVDPTKNPSTSSTPTKLSQVPTNRPSNSNLLSPQNPNNNPLMLWKRVVHLTNVLNTWGLLSEFEEHLPSQTTAVSQSPTLTNTNTPLKIPAKSDEETIDMLSQGLFSSEDLVHLTELSKHRQFEILYLKLKLLLEEKKALDLRKLELQTQRDMMQVNLRNSLESLQSDFQQNIQKLKELT
uniref:DH domain-containing protein n=1 Tax=Arcella intermedia TaxID=1963864 RepID=A0A6B2L377_9EUKA|eukprot:TRINITY_DN7658_c0_g2_i1.p1 TRINITY_DN7658_c0_g2~~TRINITY_DN7658_c0_g2_i1.p1  ORF type:complete len:471 (-),score=120.97 TRINITY_DN7658_c0_g2_i1:16-1428(-)